MLGRWRVGLVRPHLASAAGGHFRTRRLAFYPRRFRSWPWIVGTSNRAALIAAAIEAPRTRVRLVPLIAGLLILCLRGPTVAVAVAGVRGRLRHGMRLALRRTEGPEAGLRPVLLRRRLRYRMRLALRRTEGTEARL